MNFSGGKYLIIIKMLEWYKREGEKEKIAFQKYTHKQQQS